jgi:hypothetical protein
LQPGGEVRRCADDRLLLRRAFADQLSDHNHPGGDPDPRLQCYGFDIEPSDSLDDLQSSTGGAYWRAGSRRCAGQR